MRQGRLGLFGLEGQQRWTGFSSPTSASSNPGRVYARTIASSVHAFDQVSVLARNDLPLDLQSRRQLVPFHTEIGGQDLELLHLARVARAHRRVGVGGLDRTVDAGPVLRAGHGLPHGLHSWDELGSFGQRLPVILAHQRHEHGVVLARVSDHHCIGHRRTQLLDMVFHWHGGDVFAAGRNDQLLEATRDAHVAIRGHASHVSGVEPAVCVDGVGVLPADVLLVLLAELRVRQVAHHDAAPPDANLALLRLGGVEHVRGPGALRLLAPADRVHLVNLDLDARASEAAAAPEVAVRGVQGGVASALAHAVDLVELHADASEELQRLD
mmetsp:Transcript_57325/g.174564  ORF Transcript_57325/g.174564 Transcript_57325/m.174564 type:complete len:326 (+) Transcript_57325:89-1066(+)